MSFQLSKLRSDGQDSRVIDDRHDGVFMTDLDTRVAAFNGSGRPVVRTLPHGGAQRQVEIPAGRVVVSGRREAVRLTVAFDANSTGLEAADRAGVLVPNGKTLTAAVRIEKAGKYAVFARTLREGRLWAPQIEVGPVQAGTLAMPKVGDYYLVGVFDLQAGETPIKFHGTGGHVAEGLVLTDDLTVAGFRIVRRP
jgi:hypothetical protein